MISGPIIVFAIASVMPLDRVSATYSVFSRLTLKILARNQEEMI